LPEFSISMKIQWHLISGGGSRNFEKSSEDKKKPAGVAGW